MPDPTLAPVPALGGYGRDFGAATLDELPTLAIVSIARPLGGEAALAAAFRDGFGTEPPEPGASALSADGRVRFLRLSPDQTFALFEHDGPDAARLVGARLGDAAWLTDQTDAWVALRLRGPASRAALERICPIDLDPESFPEDRFARTVMEHLGAIVLRAEPDGFLLLAARSSAASFLHAVETSIRNTL